ncbi:MAG TPA: phosphoribosylglycinamide formyltransferase [Moraxellaceae bacterium]|nr:phosphoribosylglycinamide formyltransferase [Moraxellaceae bacterium]
MLSIVVLVSGSGSNLQAIIDSIAAGHLKARIAGVLSNRADAYGLVRAQQAGIATAVLAHTAYADRESFDAAMMEKIDAWQPDVVVLAGFMRILTPGFVQHFEGRLVNIHPSLLPRYKGLHTHRRALENGDSEHGCSVHFVSAELDGGPVIGQAVVPVLPGDDETILTERVHKSEHRLYPEVLILMADGRLVYRDGLPWLDGKKLDTPVRLDLSA